MLDKARQLVPDVMILDVGLPDISGFELCRQLLALHPALPVLFLTARSEEVDRLLGLEIGADDYVAKPFSPREVCASAHLTASGEEVLVAVSRHPYWSF